MPRATESRAQTSFILFTDIYRSSSLWERYPEEFSSILEAHNKVVEQAVESRNGEVMKNLGDGYIALFDTADVCISAMVDVEIGIAALPNLPDGTKLLLRVVAHGGQLKRLAVGKGYFGHALNRASRIVQVCHPGQALVSEAVHAHLAEAPARTKLDDLGSHHLRDLEEPEHLYQLTHPEFAQHEFPPLPTLSYRPNNLVYQPNSFVGRAREMDELRELILVKGQRLVTITSPGGYGKSRLATQLCANMLDQFANGVFEVLLAPVTEQQRVVSATADALRFQFFGKGEPKQQLLDYLCEKNMLILFDNFEHVIESKELLAEILKSAPKVSILVTSREPLRLTGELVYALEPLPTWIDWAGQPGREEPPLSAAHPFGKELQESISESVQLFIDRAILVKRGFSLTSKNIELISELCGRLEGVPLAVELAAAWTDSFTLQELLEEVKQQHELTARMADVPERQRSIRASMDWSYNLLSNEQAAILRATSTFKSGFFLEAARAVINMPHLRKLLTQLSDKSWLFSREVLGKTRFFVRDAATHQYASGKLGELDERDGTVLAHARYFAELTEHEARRLTGSGQLEALNVLGVELENIYDALDVGLKHERVGILLPLADRLSRFLEITGRCREGLAHYERMLLVAQKQGSTALKTSALNGLAVMQQRCGGLADAEKMATEALGCAKALGDKTQIARAMGILELTSFRLGRYLEAKKLRDESLRLYRENGDRYGIAMVLNTMAGAARYEGRYEEAKKLFEKSLSIRREIGDRLGVAATLQGMGALAHGEARLEDAEKLYNESLEIRRETGNLSGVAELLLSLGAVAHAAMRFDDADRLYRESQDMKREIGDRLGIAIPLYYRSILACYQGRFEDAEKLAREGLDIKREIGDRHGIALLLDSLGSIARAQGRCEEAVKLHGECVDIMREIGDRGYIAMPLRSLGAAYAKLGKAQEARACLAEGIQAAREIASTVDMDIAAIAAGYLLARESNVRTGAVILAGGEWHAQEMGLAFFTVPIEEEMLMEGKVMVQAALSPDEIARLTAQGEIMSLEELAEYTLKALEEMKKRD
jgi:predicted ATPase/class 3 adenylate cyclase/uncharacterized protein HemY